MKAENMNRREFLQKIGKGSLGAASLIYIPGIKRTENEFDLLIRRAWVVDGTGQKPFLADVGIKGKSIKSIGEIGNKQAGRIIEAEGLYLAPGFIDVHNHTDVELLVCPTGDSLIRQGITTVVGGNCGSSRFPLTEQMLSEENKNLKEELGLEIDWQDLKGFFNKLGHQPIALNFATLVGQGTIRAAVVGYNNRRPTLLEMNKMKSLLTDSMAQGAVGLSTGLEYAPGSFASTEELIELVQTIRPFNGIYATHMRDEQDGVLEAVDEAITIAERAGVSLEISHLKVGYPRNWNKIGALLEKIDQAAARGIKIAADVYPYTAFSTGLSVFFPLWVREGQTEDFLNRLRSPELQPKLKEAIYQAENNIGSWDKVLIASVRTEKNRRLEGLNIEQASKLENKEPFAFIRDLLLEEKGQVSMVCFAMSEDNLIKILRHPLTSICTDSELASTTGILAKGKPHPRYYGSFPRAIAEYVRKQSIMPLEQMIRKMTAFPAEKFRLKNRGKIKPGFAADLVLFDFEHLEDKATWSSPHQYPEGLPYVIVNGRVVVDNNKITGELPGKILKNEIQNGLI
ncbi:MAG TPA: D-aminoacylase [Candidatus Aminicenantes bacterium]|nr:D-aminoacylase [Candidatus Aminicenantes bacterium]